MWSLENVSVEDENEIIVCQLKEGIWDLISSGVCLEL